MSEMVENDTPNSSVDEPLLSRIGRSRDDSDRDTPGLPHLSFEETFPPIRRRRSLLSPRRRFSRRAPNLNCQVCGFHHSLISSKHDICYDCLVHRLSASKVFQQGFDISKHTGEKMCIVCLDHNPHIGDKYRICVDCLIKRLGDLNLLNFKESEDLTPIFLITDTDISNRYPADWQRKKYLPCDLCAQDVIDETRKERVCLDCLFDSLLSTPYFKKETRRVYFHS